MITKIHHFFWLKISDNTLNWPYFLWEIDLFWRNFLNIPKKTFFSPQKCLFFMSISQKQFESIKGFQHQIGTFWFVLTQFHTNIFDSNPKMFDMRHSYIVLFFCPKKFGAKNHFLRLKKAQFLDSSQVYLYEIVSKQIKNYIFDVENLLSTWSVSVRYSWKTGIFGVKKTPFLVC